MFSFFKNKKKSIDLSNNIRNIFGFKPENISLYELAFMHRSAHVERNGHEISNERLEFLGDAVISLIVADYLFKKFPFSNEGELTEMRSRIVSRNSLNKIADRLGIGELVTVGCTPISSSYLGNAFEALFGAIYIDKGYLFAKKLLIEFVFAHRIDVDTIISTEINFKSKLLEYCQKEKKVIEFNIIDEVQYGRKKQYVCEVVIDGKTFGHGIDFSIKAAEQNAAEKTIDLIKNNDETIL